MLTAQEIEVLAKLIVSWRGGTLAVVIAVVVLLFVRFVLLTYLTKRVEGLATKKDLLEITHTVEGVKAELVRFNAVEEQRRKLKHEACLEALSVIDAHFSQVFQPQATLQEVSTTRAREAHSKLILSCNDVRIVEKFGEIYFGPVGDQLRQAPTDLLNEFRNLVRAELGFGGELALSRERAWVGSAIGDPKTPVLAA